MWQDEPGRSQLTDAWALLHWAIATSFPVSLSHSTFTLCVCVCVCVNSDSLSFACMLSSASERHTQTQCYLSPNFRLWVACVAHGQEKRKKDGLTDETMKMTCTHSLRRETEREREEKKNNFLCQLTCSSLFYLTKVTGVCAFFRNGRLSPFLSLSLSLPLLSCTHHMSNREYTQTHTSLLNTCSSWIETARNDFYLFTCFAHLTASYCIFLFAVKSTDSHLVTR